MFRHPGRGGRAVYRAAEELPTATERAREKARMILFENAFVAFDIHFSVA